MEFYTHLQNPHKINIRLLGSDFHPHVSARKLCEGLWLNLVLQYIPNIVRPLYFGSYRPNITCYWR